MKDTFIPVFLMIMENRLINEPVADSIAYGF